LKVAVAPGGSPLAESVTRLLNAPPNGGTLTLTSTDPPCATGTGVGGAVTVYAVLTVSMSTAEVDPASSVSPEYTAVMLSTPAGRLLVVKVAAPELRVSVPRSVEPL
jgi:hypothetical protein